MPINVKSPHIFALWWAIKTPKKIVLILKRIIQIFNNTLAFSVNIRLLFTPLFGDYTVVGRLIGFTVRIFEIIFGTIVIGFLAVVTVVLPLFWLLLPLILFYEFKGNAILIILGAYSVWALLNVNIPEKKTKECTESDFLKSFKPETLTIYNLLKTDFNAGIDKITHQKTVLSFLERLELNKPEFINSLKKVRVNNIEDIAKEAFKFAKESKGSYVESEELLIGIIKAIPSLDNFLAAHDAKLKTVESGARWAIYEQERKNRAYIWQDEYDALTLGGFGKGMTGRVTPFLDSISQDYTRHALQQGYEKNAARKDSIYKLADLLNSSSENILIVGEPGSGKTSLVKGLAYEIMHGTSHKALWNKRIVSIELSGILSGTTSSGEIAQKIKYAIGEAKASGNIILFIDEINTLVAGSESKTPEMAAVFNLLEPELSSGDIQFIAASTLGNYRKYIEPNGSFSRLFHLFEITEATNDETFIILEFVIRELERKKKVFITYPAIDRCIELSKKFMHERVLPDKAIQIIDRAATYIESRGGILDSKVIADVVADITHIPSDVVTQDEAKKVLELEDTLKKMVVGQDHALKQIASSLKRARAGVRNTNKPIASFLFVGTTGVGKTQTAKALAKSYFGDAKAMIRLDMSEYQQLDSISRLLGAPDSSTKGILTEAVRTRPFALILLDELEKAHPNILLTFLQVLDDGRLTDSSGTTIDFTNTIIIATSNVGTKSIQKVFEENGTQEQMIETAMRDVKANYAPEFLNRFTGIIVFNPLTVDNVRKIITILLEDIRKNAAEKNIKIGFSNELIEELIKRGYSKEWGARPMLRVIEDTVELNIAENILAQKFKSGDEITLGMEVFS